MSERDEAGLRRLKRDLDESDWPAPELLARYATEPNRLSETEKQTVERALTASPLVADELATLRGFDFARLDADRRPGVAGARDAADPELDSASGLARFVRRWLGRPPVWAAVAALLALTFWLAQTRRADGPTGAPDAPPQLVENAPAPTPPQSPPSVVVEPDTAAPAERPAPTIAEASPPSPDEERLAQGDSRPPSSAPGTTPPQATPPPAPAPTPAPGGERAPGTATPKGEILLAMAMPDYQPAYGVDSMAGGEWIVRGGDDGAARITVLAPDHVTRACSARPVLHWSLDRLPAAGDFHLTIVDERDEPVVADHALARPAKPGLQRIDLGALGIALPGGTTLRWSVALRADDASPPEAFDFGWLRVEPPDAATADPATRGEDARAAGYAALGCYAEALEAVLRARTDHPGDPAPGRALEALARRAGFDPALARE